MMKGKKAALATSTLLIIIATLILIAAFMAIYFSELDDLVSDSYTNTKLTQSKITKGFTILQVDAFDGTNNYFNEFYLDARLLPDADAIDLNSTSVLVSYSNWSAALSYRSGVPVQNDSGYVGYANGTGFYQVAHTILSDFHRSDHVVRGEMIKIYVHVPENIPDSSTIGFDIINPDGISYPITAFTGDTIPAKEIVTLFPRI